MRQIVCVREPGKRPRYLPDDGPGGRFEFEVLACRLVEGRAAPLRGALFWEN